MGPRVENFYAGPLLCAIGSIPQGNGIVDVQDLIVLAEHLFEDIPPVEQIVYWKQEKAKH
jgi:hypothetical protein